MATKLEKPLTREVSIDHQPHTVVISPEGIRITGKRMRRALVSRTWEEMAQLADTHPKAEPGDAGNG